VHFTPVQVASQLLVPVQLFMHCLAMPTGWQLSSQLWVSPQLPLPLMTMGGLPALPVVPPLPPLLEPAPLELPP